MKENAMPGDMVTFGVYPQTAAGTDLTPIQWRVLENSGTELFLLSEYILDCKRYHCDFIDITWQDSDLRAWLNNDFYETTFSTAEKERIKMVICEDNGKDSPDTEDKIFLLGANEVRNLTTTHHEDNKDNKDNKDSKTFSVRRRAVGTEFTKVKKADGCNLYAYNLSVKADYIMEDGIEKGCSWWWLRTQLGEVSRAAFVGPRSSIRSYCRVNRTSYGVRPALKLAL
jgi:hypothetical protein